MHHRGRAERQRHRAAEAQRAGIAAAAHHHPARACGHRADAERGADGIDHQQHEDDAEASERCTGEVGGVEPAAAVGHARQQQRDADAAFGQRDHEGDGRGQQRQPQIFQRHQHRRAQKADHGADAGDGKPGGVAREFGSDAFGRIADGVVVDLHRAAGQPEHRQRNRREREMVIQHHAEEARDQDLVGQRDRSQYENRKIMAAGNSREGLQNRAPQ